MAATITAAIPFSGFYYSAHDAEMDWALEQYFQHPETGDSLPGFVSRAWGHIDWPEAQTAYARAYAENFAHSLKISGAEFDAMESPREYNFTTDRVFMRLPLREVYRIRRETPGAMLAAVAAEMFTSRPGFASFYSPKVADWGAISAWDHNKILALLTAYARHVLGDDWSESDLMESERCNSGLEEMLARAGDDEFKRLARAYAYLRTRHDRGDRACFAA